jgi:CRP-like cAMP-binding protein
MQDPDTIDGLEGLLRCEVFDGVDRSALQRLAAHARTRQFKGGQLALLQGESSGFVHVILSGAFKVTYLSQSGGSVTLAVMGSGELFGEIAFLDHGEHSAGVTALMRSTTLSIDCNTLDLFVGEYPAVRTNLSRLLTARLRRLSAVSEGMALEQIAVRLARRLLDLAR